jgi:hypothetical protein
VNNVPRPSNEEASKQQLVLQMKRVLYKGEPVDLNVLHRVCKKFNYNNAQQYLIEKIQDILSRYDEKCMLEPDFRLNGNEEVIIEPEEEVDKI